MRRAREVGILSLVLVCAAGAASSGCGAAAKTEIHVQSGQEINGGKVLHMMVRAVDEKTATTSEAYQDAAAMLFSSAKDESFLASQPIFPGKPATVKLDKPTGKDLVLYFFFTSPGDHWRAQVGQPPPSEVYVELGQNQIEKIQVRR
jgi:hypothetical protein